MKNILKIIGAVVITVLWFTVGIAVMGYIIGIVVAITFPIIIGALIISDYMDKV